jgi:hypothetical protein
MINESVFADVMHLKVTFAATYETPLKEMEPRFHPIHHMFVGEATFPLDLLKVRCRGAA